MMKAVFDTNILIDCLNGLEPASKELSLYGTAIISIITFVEVLVGAQNDGDEKIIRGFLARFGSGTYQARSPKRRLLSGGCID